MIKTGNKENSSGYKILQRNPVPNFSLPILLSYILIWQMAFSSCPSIFLCFHLGIDSGLPSIFCSGIKDFLWLLEEDEPVYF